MTSRKVKSKLTGFRTKDGAGVSLVRVLGNQTMNEFDPILMLDSFIAQIQMTIQLDFPYIHTGELRQFPTLLVGKWSTRIPLEMRIPSQMARSNG